MARRTKKFHRIKSKKAINAIRARRRARPRIKPLTFEEFDPSVGCPAAVDSKTLLPPVDLHR